MPAVTLCPLLKSKFFDNSGIPLNGGKLFSYLAATTTKTATYTSASGVTPNANPVILNFRGEADVFIEPNKGYKFVLAPATDTDPPTNPIWTLDNVRNSQLLSLYGGTDTGVANAYVLTFVAPFTSLTDGILIYWTPANTNLGTIGATLNVNGLGPVPILNQDGSTLAPGQIIANQVVQTLYRGGSWVLVSSGSVPRTGSFAGTLTGLVTSPLAITVRYVISGNVVSLWSSGASGVSSTTGFTLTGLPAALRPSLGAVIVPCLLSDNSVFILGYAAVNQGGAGVIVFGAGAANNQAGFTAALVKGVPSGWSITYPLPL